MVNDKDELKTVNLKKAVWKKLQVRKLEGDKNSINDVIEGLL